MQNEIDYYLAGQISKPNFLRKLVHHEETHQICFCTIKSLLTLEHANKNNRYLHVAHIGEPLVEAFMLDRNIDEIQATDIFFTSNTFSCLSDKSTGLYLKSWEEIYEMLKRELSL
ncbi:hypothetical protein FACS1894181_04140 [Bacteroidia bacterium]|nr:hypothetical protein FACS1894181_04140 [Bacteroidia bacterium]